MISHVVAPRFQLIVSAGHAAGTHGSTVSTSPRTVNPSTASSATRYTQLAEPVYQVQPPRPACGATEGRSAAMT